jgi:phosphonate transport system ATP-binding protein
MDEVEKSSVVTPVTPAAPVAPVAPGLPTTPTQPADVASVFRLTNVSMAFGSVQALTALSLSILPREHIAIIGPSGAGKTTLFRLLAGVIKPTAGCVESLGYDTRRLRAGDLRALRRQIGLLYQNDNLIPHLRVVHNVLMGRLGHWSLPRAVLSLLWPQELPRAKAVLAEVELSDKLWSLPGELSGGQQQRVAIARLLAQEPSVLLADELVSQLDVRLARQMIVLLNRYADRSNATVVMNLHTLELLPENFSRVIALRDGQLFWQGTPNELTHDLLKDLYGAEYRALNLDGCRLDV